LVMMFGSMIFASYRLASLVADLYNGESHPALSRIYDALAISALSFSILTVTVTIQSATSAGLEGLGLTSRALRSSPAGGSVPAASALTVRWNTA